MNAIYMYVYDNVSIYISILYTLPKDFSYTIRFRPKVLDMIPFQWVEVKFR